MTVLVLSIELQDLLTIKKTIDSLYLFATKNSFYLELNVSKRCLRLKETQPNLENLYTLDTFPTSTVKKVLEWKYYCI